MRFPFYLLFNDTTCAHFGARLLQILELVKVTTPPLERIESVQKQPVAIDEITSLIDGWMRDHGFGVLSNPNQTFEDAGFDSLDSVELAFYLQDKRGVEIDETVLHHYPTFADLARYVADRS
jgi:acyl carrier protein